MYRSTLYETSAAQLAAAFAMSDEQALARSRELRATHIPALGYYANLGQQHQGQISAERAPDIARAAHELAIHLTDEPRHDEAYTVAPYCIEPRNDAERVIRGIALWTRRPVEVPRHPVSPRAIWFKSDRLVTR